MSAGKFGNKHENVLISMPFGFPLTPSLGISLIKSSLKASGMNACIFYFSLLFARIAGMDAYYRISERLDFSPYHEIGEWIFSKTLYGDKTPPESGYIEKILRNPAAKFSRFLFPLPENFIKTIQTVQKKADTFLDACMDEIDKTQPLITGFSCMFQQKTASLSLARRIKQSRPDTFIVFGGADCEGIKGIEILRQFPFVDAVISGKAEEAFPRVVRNVRKGISVNTIEGVFTRENIKNCLSDGDCTNAPGMQDLDKLPEPDFDDYFHQLHESGLDLPFQPFLVLETSRGCWWGEKKRCAFCGLNGNDIHYRRKSGKRAYREITSVARRYRGLMIHMADCSLDTEYFQDLISELGRKRLNSTIFYETRATLTRGQLKALKRAGIKKIQPGIESLSTPVLKLMRKGTTGLRNIQLLKWCRELNLDVSWNMLAGIPSEPPSAYSEMSGLVPLITHLRPPVSFRYIHLVRQSPYFENPDEFGLSNIQPSPAYSFIYPFSPETTFNLSHYFTYDYNPPRNVRRYTACLEKAINLWRKNHENSILFSVDSGGRLFIVDSRKSMRNSLIMLTGTERLICKACDEIQNISQLRDYLGRHTGQKFTDDDVTGLVAPLIEDKLIIKEGSHYLSLAVPVHSSLRKKEILSLFHDLRNRKTGGEHCTKKKLSSTARNVRISKISLDDL
jgi:ribosomal peptide maturation radical SAM protein 1